jgi:hypothetical protein
VFAVDPSLENIRRRTEVTELARCSELDRLPRFILTEEPADAMRSRVLTRLKLLFGPTENCIPLCASSNCVIKEVKFSTCIKHTSYYIKLSMVDK